MVPLLAIVGVDPLLLVGGVLVGLLAMLSHLTRRIRGGGAGHGRQTVALTGQHAIHVVEIAGRRLLVGTGPSGAPRVLVELGEAEAVEPEQTGASRPWAELIERFGGLGGR
ncbi:MAG TPA: flagellar biosynthetic protein FliO [Enhygromyxa sp.]|nr:flagellar biosynthetic protein FliO [Enhygromyxa sp.]